MSRYRYTADARLIDGTWIIQVEGFRGIVEECDQASVPNAARHFIANNLRVPADLITVAIRFWRPQADQTWRDRTEFYPKGEPTIGCRIFQGGDVLDAITELQNWLASNADQLGNRDDTAGIQPINAVFAFDPTQQHGNAPVEISFYYEQIEELNEHAITVASAVVAELHTLGITTHITEDSDGDRAVITHPPFQFIVETDDEAHLWIAETKEGEIDSPLDGLTAPHDVARAIQQLLAAAKHPDNRNA